MKVSVCRHVSVYFQVILKLSSPWAGCLLLAPAKSSPSPAASGDFSGFSTQHIKTVRGADNDALQAALAYL